MTDNLLRGLSKEDLEKLAKSPTAAKQASAELLAVAAKEALKEQG